MPDAHVLRSAKITDAPGDHNQTWHAHARAQPHRHAPRTSCSLSSQIDPSVASPLRFGRHSALRARGAHVTRPADVRDAPGAQHGSAPVDSGLPSRAESLSEEDREAAGEGAAEDGGEEGGQPRGGGDKGEVGREKGAAEEGGAVARAKGGGEGEEGEGKAKRALRIPARRTSRPNGLSGARTEGALGAGRRVRERVAATCRPSRAECPIGCH